MLVVKMNALAGALGVSARSVSTLVKGLPVTRDGRWRLVALADLLPRLGVNYAHAVPSLFAASADDGRDYVGSDLAGTVELEKWLVANVPGAEAPIAEVRALLFGGLAQMDSNLWLHDAERLRALVIRTQALGFVLSKDRAYLPDGRFWRVFYLLHASALGTRGVAA